jgi:hypothetical protein
VNNDNGCSALIWRGPASVSGVRRGAVELDLDGDALELRVNDEETEKAFATHFGGEGTALFVFFPPGATEKHAMEVLEAERKEAVEEVERLKQVISALEESKGVRAVRFERGRYAVVTAPGLDEQKAAMLIANAYAAMFFDGQIRTMAAATGFTGEALREAIDEQLQALRQRGEKA